MIKIAIIFILGIMIWNDKIIISYTDIKYILLLLII